MGGRVDKTKFEVNTSLSARCLAQAVFFEITISPPSLKIPLRANVYWNNPFPPLP